MTVHDATTAPVTVLTPTALEHEQYVDLCKVIDLGGQRIILDLGRLPRIGSLHLGYLAGATARARGAGGVLVLVKPRGPYAKVLDLVGEDILRVFETGEEAGAWLQNQAGAS